DEAAEYYFTYINQVPVGDVLTTLDAQLGDTVQLMESIDDDHSLFRYAEGKWSIRQVLSHINDNERVFVFRALWFARAMGGPLPGFDQDIAVDGAYADERSWSSHIQEFRAVRQASLAFFNSVAPDVWARRGVASDNTFTVRALAYITAGHVAHHNEILRSRYLK
ncbi:MAG TPA: DinB family protein, partial [Gemmatimonadaceae bacterium]|nr:DinB family protein [Gemmatimonadaceae bacterium]